MSPAIAHLVLRLQEVFSVRADVEVQPNGLNTSCEVLSAEQLDRLFLPEFMLLLTALTSARDRHRGGGIVVVDIAEQLRIIAVTRGTAA